MSGKFPTPTFITSLTILLLAQTHKTTDFGAKPSDSVLLGHYNYLTRYDHSFEDLPKGDCGELFQLSVNQYNEHLKSDKSMALVNMLLEDSEFDENECKHVSGGYTWVLLRTENEGTICEVHVPLDLRNYDKEDREDHPLFNKKYAERAIRERDTWCYYIDEESLEKKEIIYIPPQEAYYEEKSTDADLNNSFNTDSNHSSNHIDYQEIEHNDDHGSLFIMEECTQEDKQRVLDLYAAEIIKDKAIGYVIYTENIFNCRAGHHGASTYIAEIRVNEELCYFHAVNDTEKGSLEFMLSEDESVISCQNFKGYP